MANGEGGITRRKAMASLGLGAAAGATGIAVGLGRTAGAATLLRSEAGNGSGNGATSGPEVVSADELTAAAAPTVPGLTYYSVNYADFFPYESSVSKVESSADLGVYGSGGGGTLIAALDLPHGSFIYDMQVWGGGGGRVTLRRNNIGVYDWDSLVDLTLPAGAGVVTASKRPGAPTAALVRVDRSQPAYRIQTWSTTAATAILDVRVGYIGSASFIPITPTRVYDSREGGGKLPNNATRTVSVANATATFGGATDVVPAGATAIAYNLTVANTTGTGFLAVYEAGGTFSASAVNWFGSNQLLSNAGIVKLGGDRSLTVQGGGGGTTDFIIDVTGYFP